MLYRDQLMRRLVIIVPLLLVMLVFSSILHFSSSGDGRIICFSVDSAGTLYIGKREIIEVWSQGRLLRTIDPQTSRSYVFRIQEDNTILLSTSTTVYTLDLHGNILRTEDEHGTHTYNEIRAQNKKEISDGENAYNQRGGITLPRIVKNGNEVVYRVSLLAYLSSIALDFTWSIIGLYALYETIHFLLKPKQ